MIAPGKPLTTIGGGISRLRTRGGSSPNVLFNLMNGYVTQAGTVKVRPGTLRNANIGQYSGAGKTKGLVAYQNQFHIFSANVVPIPPNYALHVLSYPKLSSLTQTITVIPPAGDPSWASVSLLAPFDTSIVDLSNNQFPMTAVAGAVTEGTTVKFGSGALACNNSHSVVTVPIVANGPMDLHLGDFTIEGWVYSHSNNNGIMIDCGIAGSQGMFIQFTNTGQIAGFVYNGATYSSTSFSGVSLNAWHMFAFVRSGNVFTMYVDGVAAASPITLAGTVGNVGSVFGIGGHATPQNSVDGFMDEVRVTKGVARYVANFTPTTIAFPAPTYTTDGPELKEIHFAAPYLGGLYVVAEFNVSDAIAAQFGSVFHYWIQSSTGGDNSNFWQKATDYVLGDVVIPTVPNGLIYTAARKDPANPVWTPNTAEALANVVEPTVANGFKYTVTLVEGAAPTTGTSEPVWPTAEGATVDENSALQNDQSFAVATAAPAAAPPVPTRYQNNGGVF